jgi:hypothetical protein
MKDSEEEIRPFRGEGNWLGTTRRNFTMPRRTWELLHKLCLEKGVDHSAMLSYLVHDGYKKEFGDMPEIQYHHGGKAK